MKLTVLGKYGAYPAPGGACSGYLVESAGGTKLLLDCGSGVLSRLGMLVPDTDAVSALILSHLHTDHMSDALNLRYLLTLQKKRMRLLLPFDGSSEFEMLSACQSFDIEEIQIEKAFRVGDCTLTFYPMTHPRTSFAVKIDDGHTVLTYSGDTTFNGNIAKSLEGAGYYLCDCAGSAALDTKNYPHMTLDQGVRIALEAGVQLLVTHIDPTCDPTEELTALSSDAIAVEEGCEYLLNEI